MTVEDEIHDPIESIVRRHDADLYDLQFEGGVLRVVLDREGGLGVDVITAVSRDVSRHLDETDPIPGRFTLEVTSPGLERRLRLPRHFEGALGETVSVKTSVDVEGQRRFEGALAAAGDEGVTIDLADGDRIVLAHDQIQRARTVFDWRGTPKPASKRSKKKSAQKQKSAEKKATKP